MSLEKDNVHGVTLYGLVFSENGKESIVLHYGLYHENANLFLVDEESYFKTDFNINVKLNNK